MSRLTLKLEQLEVVSFEAEPRPEPSAEAAVAGSGGPTCLGWYSCYVKCFGTVVTVDEVTCAAQTVCTYGG